MMNPKTRLMLAARIEAPNDNRYDPSARGLSTTCRNSPQCIDAVISTSAARGISTMLHRKKVVKPKVNPKPGRTLGCDSELMRSREASRETHDATDRKSTR